MAETVSWMVKRETSAKRFRVTCRILRCFLAGGLVGGALMGLLVAGIARLFYVALGNELRPFSAAAAALAIAYLGTTLGVWRMPKPQIAQQVPSSWREVFPPGVASFLYASALGLTFFTRIGSLALFPLLALSLGLGQWPLAIVSLFAITGFFRAATALIVPVSDWIDVSGWDIFSTLTGQARRAQRLESVVLAVSAAILIVNLV